MCNNAMDIVEEMFMMKPYIFTASDASHSCKNVIWHCHTCKIYSLAQSL